MTDTTTLSGYLLDYYAALAENMPNPRLRKHEREDTYICVMDNVLVTPSCNFIASAPTACSPTKNPALALPIIEKLVAQYGDDDYTISTGKLVSNGKYYCQRLHRGENQSYFLGDTFTEAALRALVVWEFPDGLPEPVFESEK